MTGGGPGSCKTPGLVWVNTVLGNVKRSMDGSYHSIQPKHLARYLAEFLYRKCGDLQRRLRVGAKPKLAAAVSCGNSPRKSHYNMTSEQIREIKTQHQTSTRRLMRIAAFNVENLFDRAKVFNHDDLGTSRQVLDSLAELNILFEQYSYSNLIKSRMLELIEQLGMLHKDEGPYTRIRKIRGRIVSRPKAPKAPFIKANGRDDWIGWCELRTGVVNETAIINTARVIRDVDADVLALIEVESRPVLKQFHELMVKKLKFQQQYRHLMVIDGNDDRGIDVGLATRDGYPIGPMSSHVDDLDCAGFPIFSRDCPEYVVTTPSDAKLVVLPNHFKSKYGGNDRSSREKRLAQSRAVAQYYNSLIENGMENVVVLGDLNDTPDSDELKPLLCGTTLRDVSEHDSFTHFEFRANNGHKGIGTHGLGNDNLKIDYLLLSPALFANVTSGGIFRKGMWPGTRPPRWTVYTELKKRHLAASDHHVIWADLNV